VLLRMRPVIHLLLGLALVACFHAATPRSLYTPRPGGPVPMSRVDSILGDAPFDLAARHEGVPLLRTVVLPPDVRELRISDWYGMIVGSPVAFLTLRQDGPEVTGSLSLLYGCGRESGSQSVKWCSRTAKSAPGLDWRSVATTLDSLGAWDLSERCESDGVLWTDSGELKIQRLKGDVFSGYNCNTPSARTGPIGSRAKAVYELFHTLVKRHVGRPPA